MKLSLGWPLVALSYYSHLFSVCAGHVIPRLADLSAGCDDPQTSDVLDEHVLATGFENDGQDVPAPGQVASLTSSNNFINFCLTTNLPITNGTQIETGSCNPAPMGMIAAKTHMPSSKFVFPANNAELQANTTFTIKMAIRHFRTGHSVNPTSNYLSAPQQLDSAGYIFGHSHLVIEKISALNQTKPTDPEKFAFFKAIGSPESGGILTTDVPGGLPRGVYRLASVNSAANHQPVLVAVVQRGSLDDMVYFTVA